MQMSKLWKGLMQRKFNFQLYYLNYVQESKSFTTQPAKQSKWDSLALYYHISKSEGHIQQLSAECDGTDYLPLMINTFGELQISFCTAKWCNLK